MNEVIIKVVNKVATNATPNVPIVCGNSTYNVTFDFDEEWAAEDTRVARFVFYKGRKSYFKEQTFSGNTVNVPILSGIDYVLVGVYSGELSTTTPARVICRRSILCDSAEEQIGEDQKKTLQTQIADLGNQITDFGNQIEGLGNQTADFGNQIEDLGNQTTDLDNRVTDLDNQITELGDLVPKVTDADEGYFVRVVGGKLSAVPVPSTVEEWTFTLEDDSTVTKKVVVME